MKERENEPVYTIGITAKMLKVCQATLRIWERKGLISPARLGKNRFYSSCDLQRLEYIKDLIRREKINIQGVKNMLNITRCWEVKKCNPRQRGACVVYQKAR